MNIENQIKDIILQRFKSVRAFTQMLGIPYSTVDTMLKRGIGGTSVQTVIKVCNALDLDIESISSGQLQPKNRAARYSLVSISDYEHLQKYHRLDEHGKESVELILNHEYNRIINLLDSENEPEPDNVIELNFSEQPSSAGTGYWLDEEQMIKKKVILNRDTAKADFCVPVSGDSMTPQFNDGDILLVRKQPAVDIGQIGIFTIDGTGFVKKFGIGQLESLNSKYEPIPINGDTDLICNGKVLGILNPEWIVED